MDMSTEITLEDIREMAKILDEADLPKPRFIHINIDSFCEMSGADKETVLKNAVEISEGVYEYGSFTLYD